MSKIERLICHKFFWSFIAFIFLFATFPGKGGFEGGQREIQYLSERSDNWGFITPFFYGEWPNFFGQWRFSLVVCQLLSYWLGFYLFFRNRWPDRFLHRIFLSVFLVFSSTFVSQLWRDATLFAFVFLGLGILTTARTFSNWFLKFFLYSISILFIFFGACFKPIYSPLIFIFILYSYISLLVNYKLKITVILLLIGFSILPYTFDKHLSNHFGLTKTYPEQQPMIYDLASVYCWGNSAKSNQYAEKGLRIIVRENVPIPAVCASLVLTSWDNLHMPMRDWIYNAPLKRLSEEQTSQFSSLRTAWFKMITNNPREYFLVKMPFATQVLTMANAFVFPQSKLNSIPKIIHSLNSILWYFFYFFSNSLDKLRIFTLGCAIFIGVIIFIRKLKYNEITSSNFFHQSYLLGYLVCTLLLVTFAYVAGNGRYVLPFVLFFYAQILTKDSKSSSRGDRI